jgi:hypothetical protein
MNAMLMGNLRISRWLLTPEMLLCFVPLTLFWLDSIGGDSGIIRLDADIIHKYFVGVRGGTIELAAMLAGAILGALGPLGLIAALRLIVLNRPLRSAWLRRGLVIGPLLFGVLTLLAHAAIAGPDAFRARSLEAFDFWSGMLLLSVLPALGAAHLLRLCPPIPAGDRTPLWD